MQRQQHCVCAYACMVENRVVSLIQKQHTRKSLAVEVPREEGPKQTEQAVRRPEVEHRTLGNDEHQDIWTELYRELRTAGVQAEGGAAAFQAHSTGAQ